MLYQDLQQRGGATDEHLNEFPGRAVVVRGDAGVNPRASKALVDKIKKDTVRVVERRLVYACAGLTEALSDGPQVYMSTRHDTTMAAVSLSANLARLIYPLTRKPIAIGIWERFGPVWQQTPVPMRRFLEAAHPRCNWPALVDGFEDPSSSSMQFRHPSWTDCAFVLRRTSAPQSVMWRVARRARAVPLETVPPAVLSNSGQLRVIVTTQGIQTCAGVCSWQ